MTTDITEVVYGVLRTHLPAISENGSMKLDANLAELGLDSLGAVNLVLDLEETLDIEFPDALLTEATFETARSLRQAVGQMLDDRPFQQATAGVRRGEGARR